MLHDVAGHCLQIPSAPPTCSLSAGADETSLLRPKGFMIKFLIDKDGNMFETFKSLFVGISEAKPQEINPATGLPLIENSQIDVAGNVSGFSNDYNHFDSPSFHSSSFSSFE